MAYTEKQKAEIQKQKKLYNAAKLKGNDAGMRIAHANADKVRGITTTTVVKDGKYKQADTKKLWASVAKAPELKLGFNTHVVTLPKSAPPKAPPKLPMNTSFGSVLDEYNTSLPGIGNQVAKNLAPERKQEIAQGTQRFFEKAPVQAGFMQGVSFNNPLKSLERKLSTDIDTTQAEKSNFYKAGELGGIATQFALPYAGASKGIAAGLTKLPKYAQLGKFGQGVAKSVTTDLAVGLPLNVNYAYNKEGLQGAEAAKSIAFNTGLDLITGGILEAVPMFLKSGKKVASRAEFDNLPPAEKTEVMSELERLAYESNVRKGKITPQNDTLYGNSFRPTMGELPAPTSKINATTKPLKQIDIGLPDLPVRYNPSMKNEARNLTDHIEVGDKFNAIDGEGQKAILGHENAHNVSNDYLFKKGYFADILNNKAFGESKTAPDGRTYWEGIFGDVGATSVDETLTNTISVFMRNPKWLKEVHPEAYDYIAKKVMKSAPSFKGQPSKLQPKLPNMYANAVGQREVPRTITRNELPRANKAQPQTLPQAPTKPVQPILPRKGAEIPTEIKMPEISQKPIGKVEQKFKDLGADTNRFEEVAMVTTDSKQTQPSLLEKAVGITREAKRKFLDSGETVARIGKINNDKGLYNLYNNAKNAGRRAEYHIGEAQTDINGNEIGKSLKAIFDPIRKKGTNYYEDFQEYMYHLHNIDRMAQEKPVFGESITAEESKKVSDYLLSQHPEFAQEAAEVRNYLDNMMQYRVQGGLVSEEGAKALNEMYSNYVPTYRLNPSTKGLTYSGQVTDIKTGIKKAVGSSKDLLPLHEQISKQTMQAVKATHDNLFGLRLAQNINPKTQQYVQELKKIQDTIDIDAEDVPELKNAFKIFENGQAYQMKVESGLYEGIQELAGKSPNDLIKAATAANKGFKELITSWSPMFLVRNVARDIQDTGLYSKDLAKFAKMYPAAIKEIASNGKVWKQYKALGGAGNSFFDYAKGYKNDPTWLRKNTLDRVEQLNMATEQLPRLTEFMATLDKLGRAPNYDELMQAMYNAADITVNFGRSGTWGKTLNSTFVPFFNPAIQGTDKIVRRFTETKGVKDWTELVLKISAFGIAPSVLNEMLYLNDPEYQRINDREKDINFLFKIGDGEFVKIPKGRVLSMFGSAAQRGLRAASGQKDAFAGYIKVMGGQVAPISPTDSNILSPIAAVKANKSWYGGTIEPQSLTTKYPSDKYQFKRFDERTSGIAKTIGKALNYSPKKIDYLIDAYSGVVGDFAIPLSTPKAEQNPFAKAFTIDSVTSNKIGQQFYDKKDEILSAKNSTEGEDKNDVLNRYMNKQGETVSDLYDQIRKIENGLGTDKVKREKVREVRALINGIQQTALDTLPEIEKTTKQLSTRITDPDELYRETNKKVFGSKYALQAYDKDVYEKAVKFSNYGVPYDNFYTVYFGTKDLESDKKPNGESIQNSLSRKKKEYIDSQFPNATRQQLVTLYELAGVSKTIGRYRPQFD